MASKVVLHPVHALEQDPQKEEGDITRYSGGQRLCSVLVLEEATFLPVTRWPCTADHITDTLSCTLVMCLLNRELDYITEVMPAANAHHSNLNTRYGK